MLGCMSSIASEDRSLRHLALQVADVAPRRRAGSQLLRRATTPCSNSQSTRQTAELRHSGHTPRQSTWLDGRHEQANTHQLRHDELVPLHCRAAQARFAGCSDWTRRWPWLAPHDGRSGRPAVFSDAAIQFGLDDYGPVEAAAPADDGHGGQPAGDGEPGLRRSRLHHVVPPPDARRPDFGSPHRWPLEPLDRQHRDQCSWR